jgi:hypothetical protein
MIATVRPMKLQDILKAHGILAASELRRRLVDPHGTPLLSRAQAWNLWAGKVGVGRRAMRMLHDHLGIPYEDLMEVDEVPAPKKGPRREHPDD